MIGKLRLDTKFVAGFFLGSLLGGAAGVALTIIVFAAWFYTVTQALVGVGTLTLSFAAVYLTRTQTQERKKRIMVQRVYTPLRNEVKSWSNPIMGSFRKWTELQENERFWAEKVPKKIVNILKEAREHFEKEWKVRPSVNMAVDTLARELAEPLRVKTGVNTRGPVTFRLLGNPGGYNAEVYIPNIWVIGKDLKQYSQEFVKNNWPAGVGAELEVQVSGRHVGDTGEAIGMSNKPMEMLDNNAYAKELRQNFRAIKRLGSDALLLIDREVS